jgi:hypothetical protein
LSAVGGSGKSSLLMGLVGSGWEAVSEDVCVVDWDESGRHRVWPGPSWVRLKNGVSPAQLVTGTSARFEGVEKSVWDLDPWMAHRPTRLEKIVLMEPPGGDEIVWEPLDVPAAITELAKQVTWLQRAADFAGAVLPQVVRLLLEVPAYRMRLPVRDDWLPTGLALLERP